MGTEPAISRWRRVRYAALSGLSGWLAGQIACLPINLIIAVRDTEGQPKLFVQTLFYGLLAWGGWTLLLALAAWVLVVLPLVMTMRPCLLVRLRLRFAHRGHVWGRFRWPACAQRCSATPPPCPSSTRFAQFIPYGAFALSFTLVTAWMYILLMQAPTGARRRIRRRGHGRTRRHLRLKPCPILKPQRSPEMR